MTTPGIRHAVSQPPPPSAPRANRGWRRSDAGNTAPALGGNPNVGLRRQRRDRGVDKMAFSVQMPELGESVTEGTVTRWLKQEGDTVELDEPLVEVSTDKVDTEIPSPAAGVLTKIVAREDDTVEVGGELAVIGDAAEDGGSQAPSEPEPQAQSAPPAQPEAQPQPEPEPQPQATAQPEPQPARQSSGGGDATPVLMPELGESVTEGTVTRWLKKVGDSVEVDEPLVEVSTDKVDTEIP